MLLDNPKPVKYSEEKVRIKIAELQSKLDLKEDGPDFEIRDLEIKEGDTKSVYIRVYHKKCGLEFHTTASKFFNKVDAKCPECGTKITLEDIRKIVEDDTNGEYTLLSTSIKNSKDSINVRHNTCGNEYKITIRKFREGSRCKCTSNSSTKTGGNSSGQKQNKTKVQLVPKFTQSQGRDEFVKFLTSLNEGNIMLENTLVPGTSSTPSFFFPELNVAIQYSELVAHSEEGSKGICDRKYFYTMMHDLDDNANHTRLINVSEEEWLYKNDIVKSKLTHILGHNKNRVIHARKCYIKECHASVRTAFLDKHHIQGRDAATVSLGLYTKENDKELLVAVMSFIKPRKALNGQVDKYDYELSRFAALTDAHVVGAFSKLMSYFKKNYEWTKLVTYADLRWTSMHKSVYLTNGFKHIHDSLPSYGYVNTNSQSPVKEFRFKYRKSELERLFPQYWNNGNTTEKEIMKQAGYVRFWDCGNAVFELENK